MPTELDVVTRRIRQLEIEKLALAEGDRRGLDGAPGAPRARSWPNLSEQRDAMTAHWQPEKDAIATHPASCRGAELEQRRSEAERLERDGDLAGASEIRYGELPDLERRIDEATERPRRAAGRRSAS